VRGGLDVPGDHQVDPRRAASALLAACVASGVQLVEDSASEVIVDGGRCGGVRTDGGSELRSANVLLASGWQSDLRGLPAGSVPAVRPVKGQILRLRMPPRLPSPTRTIRGLVHGQGIYIVPRRDREIVVGATVEERGEDATVTAGAVYVLLRDALAVLPVLAEAELVETSVGFRPGTPDNAPFIGHSTLDGLLVATGHFRNGILLAPVTADLVAGLLSSPGTELPPWATPFDPRRPGATVASAVSA
jgi:glycine oxidase